MADYQFLIGVCGILFVAIGFFIAGFFVGDHHAIKETEKRWSDAVGRTCQTVGCERRALGRR